MLMVTSQHVNLELLYLPTGLEGVDGTTVLGKLNRPLEINY